MIVAALPIVASVAGSLISKATEKKPEQQAAPQSAAQQPSIFSGQQGKEVTAQIGNVTLQGDAESLAKMMQALGTAPPNPQQGPLAAPPQAPAQGGGENPIGGIVKGVLGGIMGGGGGGGGILGGL